jgi:hypothetical protein
MQANKRVSQLQHNGRLSRRTHAYLGANALMRTPVVKRQTSPESGFLLFFRRVAPGVVILWQRVLTWFRSAGAALMWLHQTLIEGLPPVQGDCRELWYGSRRPRNISVPSYRPTQKRGCTLLCPSEYQARVRGSTQSPSVTSAIGPGARAGVQSNAQGQGKVPLGSWAFVDARAASLPSTMTRLHPW